MRLVRRKKRWFQSWKRNQAALPVSIDCSACSRRARKTHIRIWIKVTWVFSSFLKSPPRESSEYFQFESLLLSLDTISIAFGVIVRYKRVNMHDHKLCIEFPFFCSSSSGFGNGFVPTACDYTGWLLCCSIVTINLNYLIIKLSVGIFRGRSVTIVFPLCCSLLLLVRFVCVKECLTVVWWAEAWLHSRYEVGWLLFFLAHWVR